MASGCGRHWAVQVWVPWPAQRWAVRRQVRPWMHLLSPRLAVVPPCAPGSRREGTVLGRVCWVPGGAAQAPRSPGDLQVSLRCDPGVGTRDPKLGTITTRNKLLIDSAAHLGRHGGAFCRRPHQAEVFAGGSGENLLSSSFRWLAESRPPGLQDCGPLSLSCKLGAALSSWRAPPTPSLAMYPLHLQAQNSVQVLSFPSLTSSSAL